MLAYKLDVLADCGSYPTLGAFLAEPDPADVERRVRDPPRRGRGNDGRHEHDATSRRCRGAGRPEAIQAIERAIDRFAMEIGMDPAEVRRRNYVTGVPAHDRHRRRVRLGRLRGRARPGAALGRLRRAPRRAEAAPRRGRDEAARDRPLLLRRDHQPARRGRARRGRDHAGRRRDRPHRLVLARPGARDDLRDDRRPSGSASRSRRSTVHKGDTDEIASGTGTYGSKSVQIGGTASREAAEHRRRAGEAAGRRLPRGEPRRRRARHRRSAASTSRARPTPRSPGRSWRRAPAEDDRLGELKASSELAGRADVPVRHPRRRRRGRHRDRRGRAPADGLRRRRGHAHQPAARRGPGARRRRDGRRAGAVRGGTPSTRTASR